MRSEQKTFGELKHSLISLIKNLKKNEFDTIIRKVTIVVKTNHSLTTNLSKFMINDYRIQSIKYRPIKSGRKSVKRGGAKELSNEDRIETMLIIAGFCVVFFGMKIYNYLIKDKLVHVTRNNNLVLPKINNVKKSFKKKRSKRLTTPPPKPPGFSSNAKRNSSDPFSI